MQTARDQAKSNPLWPTIEPASYDGRQDEPTKAEILLQLGVLYWRRGDLNRSEQLLSKAREIAEKDKNIKFLAQCFIGLALVKNGLDKTSDAIVSYEQASTFIPDNYHIWNNLGNLYSKNKDFKKAHEAFKKALKLNQDDIPAWLGLANSYYQSGSVDESIRAYTKSIFLITKKQPKISHNPTNLNKQLVLVWQRLAELYTKKSQYQKAIAAYQNVLTLEQGDANIWNEIGALYARMEIFDEAIVSFSKATDIDPNYGEAYLNLANTYSKLGKHQESIPVYLKSIERLKNQREIMLATTLMKKAESIVRINKVTTQYDDVTWFYYKYNEEVTSISFPSPTKKVDVGTEGEREMSPILPFLSRKHSPSKTNNSEGESTNPLVWNEKGNIHFKNKAYDDAIFAYNKAIKLDPNFGHPYNNLALIQFTQGNFGEAILLYQESIKLLKTNQEKAIVWNGLGNAYRCIKDYESARIAYQNASKIDPINGGVYESTITYEAGEKYKTADFWKELGMLFFKSGVYDKAASAFREAIQLEPSSGYTYGYLARVLTAQGKYQEAVSLYHKSIDLIPNNSEKASAWNRLGDVHRKLNDYDNALQAYQNGTALTNSHNSLLNRTRFSLLSNCATKQ